MNPGARGVFLATTANIRHRRETLKRDRDESVISNAASQNESYPTYTSGHSVDKTGNRIENDRERRTLRTDPNLAKILDEKNRPRARASRNIGWTDIVQRVTANNIGYRLRRMLDDSTESTFSQSPKDHHAHLEEGQRKKPKKLKYMTKEERMSHYKFFGNYSTNIDTNGEKVTSHD